MVTSPKEQNPTSEKPEGASIRLLKTPSLPATRRRRAEPHGLGLRIARKLMKIRPMNSNGSIDVPPDEIVEVFGVYTAPPTHTNIRN